MYSEVIKNGQLDFNGDETAESELDDSATKFKHVPKP